MLGVLWSSSDENTNAMQDTRVITPQLCACISMSCWSATSPAAESEKEGERECENSSRRLFQSLRSTTAGRVAEESPYRGSTLSRPRTRPRRISSKRAEPRHRDSPRPRRGRRAACRGPEHPAGWPGALSRPIKSGVRSTLRRCDRSGNGRPGCAAEPESHINDHEGGDAQKGTLACEREVTAGVTFA